MRFYYIFCVRQVKDPPKSAKSFYMKLTVSFLFRPISSSSPAKVESILSSFQHNTCNMISISVGRGTEEGRGGRIAFIETNIMTNIYKLAFVDCDYLRLDYKYFFSSAILIESAIRRVRIRNPLSARDR